MATMKAVRIHQWGGNEVVGIEDVDIPRPGTDEVRIQLRAASINPVDWKIREGYLQEWFTLPLTLGKDGAGDVVEVGEHVHALKIGDAVCGHFGHTFAEFTVAKAADIVRTPAGLDYFQAAALPLAGLTAWRALMNGAELRAGQHVLIHGAAGGVGSLAVQFARIRGARVMATASADNEAFVRALGADTFLDYRIVCFEDVVQDVDVVFDAVGGETLARSYAVVRPGGTLVTIAGQPSPESAAEHRIRVLGGDFSQPSHAILSEISNLVESGRVKIHVSQIYPFSAVKQALTDCQRGHIRGKLVLQVQN